MNSAANDNSAFGERAQRGRHERAGRGKNNCSVEFFGRHFIRTPGPNRAQRARGVLSGFISRSRESEDFLSLIQGDLRNQMGRVAESVNAKPACFASFPIRSIAKHSGTKQRRDSRLRQRRFGGQVDIEKFVWEMKAISRVGHGELGIAAVKSVTGESRVIAKIFAVRPAINAPAIGPAEPWNANAVTNVKLGRFNTASPARTDLLDAADNLVTKNERKLRIGQFAVDNVKIGAANGADANADE